MMSTGFHAGMRAAAILACLLATAIPATAQRYGLREVRDVGTGGVNLVVAVPMGEFRRHVDVAGGVDVFGAINLGRGSPVALRLGGSYLLYGHDKHIVTQPYYPLAINTTYSIATFGVGPQLTFGTGPLKVYGFGTFGASYISARSSFRVDGCGCDTFDSVTDFDDWTSALQTGGGLLISLSTRHVPVALDLGARYLHNGEAWFVSPGDVVPQSTGDVFINPVFSRADLVMLHVGVSVGIR
ncbi:MAG TPA: hypothetical protein VH833_12130 [Gemmatimonadales bacterium]